jgi:6-phosphogluconolactonase (cycloisomerase 2 family)
VAAIVDPTGRFLYVANATLALTQFSIDGSTGALTPLTASGPSAGTNPAFFVFDPDGKYLYVGNVGSKNISEFTINSDGSLATTSNTISLSSVPRGLALTH